MIPKVIHYCWFSNEPKPKNVKKCIRSWKKHLPGYKIKCWDSSSFDFNSIPYVKEAYEAKKWAFVSDYIRLHALYTEGGIYLDSDVQAIKPIDEWLSYDLFTGIEKRGDTDELFIEAAIIGSQKGNKVIKNCLDLYEGLHFRREDGSYNQYPLPSRITPIFVQLLQWSQVDRTELLADGTTIILSTEIIANTESQVSDSIYLYHWNNRSWIDRNFKEKVYKFLKDLGIIQLVR